MEFDESTFNLTMKEFKTIKTSYSKTFLWQLWGFKEKEMTAN